MSRAVAITNLEQLLERLGEAEADDGRVTIEAMLDEIGHRSFGPLILFAGLATLSPVGDIPGIPSIIAVYVLLTSGQMLAGRRSFWLPRWLLKRSLSQKRLEKSLRWLQRPAAWVDRLIRPRLAALTGVNGRRAIAAACLVIGLALPPMDFVPFSATGGGAALTAFGLAVIAHDGVLAALAFAITATVLGVVIVHLL
jgi:hypothetical protein